MIRIRRASRGIARALAAGLLAVAGCTQTYHVDSPDISVPVPDDLDLRLQRFRSGEEKWHGDPKAVADAALRRHLDVNQVPWIADPFRPGVYTVKHSAEWGTYVVRGYTYPSGHEMRYRVKVRPHQEIWYPIQVSHYKMVDLPHPALEDR